MNFITRTLLPLFLLTSLGNSIQAMDQQIALCKNMNTQEVIDGIKGLPEDIRRYIISLLVHYSIFDFKLSKTITTKNRLSTLAFSPDGEHFLGGFENNSMRGLLNFPGVELWNIKAEDRVTTFKGNDSYCEIASVAFSPTGERCVAALGGIKAFLWDSKTGKLLQTFKRHATSTNSTASSPEKTCITGSQALVMSPAVQNSLLELLQRTNHIKNASSFLPDPLFWGSGLPFSLGNPESRNSSQTFKGHTQRITSVAYSPDEETVLTGSYDTTACLWSCKTGEVITTFIGHSDIISSVAFSPNGKFILTGSADKTACVWDSKTGALITTFRGHTYRITSVAFSPDGTKCITGSWDNTACVWNSTTGEFLILPGHTAMINCVAFSPDGTLCITGSHDKTTSIWNATTGEHITTLVGHTGKSVESRILMDAELAQLELSVLMEQMAFMRLQNLNLQPSTETDIDSTIISVAFSADGETCLIGLENGKIYVWKRICGLICLTENRKKAAFKHFLTFYPILQNTIHPSSDKVENQCTIS